MIDTLFTRTRREDMPSAWLPACDMLEKLTGDATFVEVFAQAPELLEFVMQQFYAKVFFGGRVEQRYKQLARLKLSLIHGCRTCNKQNIPGALEAGFTAAQIDALRDGRDELFNPAERAVIEYAAEVALSNIEGRMTPASLCQAARALFGGPDPRARHGHGGDIRHGEALVRSEPGGEGIVLPVRDRRRLTRHAAISDR